MPAPTQSGRRIRIVVLFTLLVVLGVFAFGRFSAYHELTVLRDSGVPTTGTVTKVDTRHHSVSYTFPVFGRTVSGGDTETPGDGGPSLDGLRPGDPIPVVFDPSDTSQSLVGEPQARIVNLEASVAITVGVVLIAGLALIYGFFFMGGRKAARAWR